MKLIIFQDVDKNERVFAIFDFNKYSFEFQIWTYLKIFKYVGSFHNFTYFGQYHNFKKFWN